MPVDLPKEPDMFRITESLPDSILILNKDRVITYANALAERMLGLSRQEMVGCAYDSCGWKILAVNRKSAVSELDKSLLKVLVEGRAFFNVEVLIQRPDEKHVTALVAGTPIRQDGGAITGAILTLTDISARKRMENRLYEKEEMFRLLTEQTPDLIYRYHVKPEPGYDYVSPASTALSGYTPDEHYADPDLFSKVVYPEDLPILQNWQRSLTGEPLIFRLVRKDGTLVWVEMRNSPIYDETGELIAFEGIVRDVTGRIKAEEALRESEARYKTLAESAPDVIFVIDRDDKVAYINSFASKMLNIPAERVIGRKRAELFPPEIAERTGKSLAKVFDTGEPLYAEDKMVFQNQANWQATWLVPLKDDKGNTYAVLGFGRDITSIKEAERELQEAKQLSDALNEINQAISSTLDVQEIMQRVVDESAKTLGAQTAGIGLREGDFWVTRYVYGAPKDMVGMRLDASQAKAANVVSRTKEPLVIEDALHNPNVSADLMKKFGIKSLILVPLMSRGEVIGTMTFNYHDKPVSFSKEQVDFVRKLGASVSLAIDNARLYSGERRVAEVLQEGLIRPVPVIPGLDLGIVYEPAYEAARVGGDFYDIFEVGRNLVAILIGDVSGKGVEAAGLTETVRSSVRTLAYIDPSPAFVLSRTNQALIRQLDAQRFVTSTLFVLNTQTGELRAANAGHPPAVLCDRRCRFVETPRGTPLGLFPSYYGEAYLRLKRGQLLVLYTDGLTEARASDGEMYGETRLIEAISQLKGEGTSDLADALLGQASRFAAGKLTDDTIIVAIRLGHTSKRLETAS